MSDVIISEIRNIFIITDLEIYTILVRSSSKTGYITNKTIK